MNLGILGTGVTGGAIRRSPVFSTVLGVSDVA
jgi:hypothetical protein